MALNKGAPDSWCPLPWSLINIKSNGTYRLCDHSASSKNKGILKNKNGIPFSITEKAEWNSIINSETIKTVRKNMLAGKWSPECARCQRERDSGMQAHNFYERNELAGLIEPENYPSYLKTRERTKSDGAVSPKDFPVSFLNIRFGNLCNLRCAMCHPADSSAWKKEYKTIWGHDLPAGAKNSFSNQNFNEKKAPETPETNTFNWIDNQHLWSEIQKHKSTFRKIYIVGGEPLLMPSYYKFLQWCVDSGTAGKLTVEFNTNLTRIPSSACRLWRQFKRIYIGISLDGCGKINDFIRYPSKWSHIERNVSRIDELKNQNIDCYIITSVSVLNIWHLPEFIEYLMKANHSQIGLWQSLIINAHPVHKPHYLNINILDEDFKEKIKNRFHEYKEKFSNYDWRSACGPSRIGNWEEKTTRVCKILDNYIKFMSKVPYPSNDLKKWRRRFIYYMDKLDQLRKTNWPETFPELYKSTLEWRKL